MTPRFKAGDYNGGIDAGVQAILALLVKGEAPAGDSVTEDAGEASQAFFEGPDLPITERILIGAFIFGIIGLFTVIGIVTPGAGWFLYFFLIPFWAKFPIIVVGTSGALTLLITYLVAFPVAKLMLKNTEWYKKAGADLRSKGRASIGGFTLLSGGSGGGWSSGGGGGFVPYDCVEFDQDGQNKQAGIVIVQIREMGGKMGRVTVWPKSARRTGYTPVFPMPPWDKRK